MSTSGRSVEILEGNVTVRRLMVEALQDVDVHVVPADLGADTPPELSDLLVVDIDSGVPDALERAQRYERDHRRVLYCGLRSSREEFEGLPWVDRPFTRAAFARQCIEVLGLGPKLDDDIPTPPDLRFRGDEPITRELGYDEAQELEKRLGLDPGALAAGTESTVSDEESFEVLDIDDSFVEEVDELRFALGGSIRGGVRVRPVSGDEIERDKDEELHVVRHRSSTFNQTMPDTPMALEGDRGQPPTNPRRRTPTGSDAFLAEGSETDIGLQIKGVARMLAESWQRIALTSRTEDRADRIEKILIAAVGKGVRGAARELERVPHASGFAGSFSALTFIDTIRTIRDRKLRGRLEVAMGDDAYVLYMDGMYLQDIDALSGNLDGMLLDILHQGGALDDTMFEELRSASDSGHFMGPVELELTRQQVVAEATIQSASVVRAREIFRRLCGARGGQFAFLEIQPGDGQPWPVEPLRINVDQLMLELLRESSIDTGDSKATARTRLLLDANRAAAVDRLTDAERDVLQFFKDGETLESARDRLQKASGPEDIDRIVDRLKKVEILKRSDPEIAVSPKVQKQQARQRTVVSDASSKISLDERAKHGEPETVGMKPNYDMSAELDTDEVDAIVEEALLAYERSQAEAEADSEADAD